jgi:hypothetical protein
MLALPAADQVSGGSRLDGRVSDGVGSKDARRRGAACLRPPPLELFDAMRYMTI